MTAWISWCGTLRITNQHLAQGPEYARAIEVIREIRRAPR